VEPIRAHQHTSSHTRGAFPRTRTPKTPHPHEQSGLTRLKLKNYRCFSEAAEIDFEDLTAIIGKNDSGKSSILDALELFFDDKLKPDQDDCSVDASEKRIEITCVFDELPDELVIDATHGTSLKEEHLLNQKGRLEIKRVYNAALKTPKLEYTCLIAEHPTADKIDDLLSLKNMDLKKRAAELEVDISKINTSINAQLRRAIRLSREDLQLKLRPLQISDLPGAKDIWERLKDSLPMFFLFKADRPSTDQDEEAQDPMKAAVKVAIGKMESQLSKVSSLVVEEIQKIVGLTIENIANLDHELGTRIEPFFDNPNWATIFKIKLKDELGISINKRGSGARRIVLLGFLQAQAQQLLEESGPNRSVIYAVEELETAQHPDKQKKLYSSISDLAGSDNTQVILTTHTPALGRLLPVDTLRYLEVGKNSKRVIHKGTEEAYELVAKSLGVLPDNKVEMFLGVEGVHDVDFLKGMSRLLLDAGTGVVDLGALEEEGSIVVIPVGGSNLAAWVSRLSPLNRTEFHIFDRDTAPEDDPKCQKQLDEFNAREKCLAVATNKREMENYLHSDAIMATLGIEIEVTDENDVSTAVTEKIKDLPQGTVRCLSEQCNAKGSRVNKRLVKYHLNHCCIQNMTLEMLDERDPDGEVKGWLQHISGAIATDP